MWWSPQTSVTDPAYMLSSLSSVAVSTSYLGSCRIAVSSRKVLGGGWGYDAILAFLIAVLILANVTLALTSMGKLQGKQLE